MNIGSIGATPRTPTSARFLKLFTVLPLDEIERLAELKGEEINEAKKILATEATALVHERTAAEASGGDRAHDLRGRRPRRQPADGRNCRGRARRGHHPPARCLSFSPDLLPSNGEVRRVIRGGGLKVNDETVYDEFDARLLPKDLTAEGVIKLSLGRKRHVLLKPI